MKKPFQLHSRTARFGALLLVPIFAAGCFGSSSEPEPEPQAKELGAPETEEIKAGELELFSVAKRLYGAQMYTLAKDSFESLKNNFPLGAYAIFAELKVADCLFHSREYSEAAKLYEEFSKNHPAAGEVPYALLQAGLSHLRSQHGVGRDRIPLEKALADFNSLLDQFSNSPFAARAHQERKNAVSRLSEYDQYVISFYEKRDKPEAARARQLASKEKWGPLLKAETPKISQVRPGTARFGPAKGAEDLTTVGTESLDTAPAPSGLVTNVECRDGSSQFIVLEFSPESGSRITAAVADSVVEPENGSIELPIPEIGANRTIDCFGRGRLRLEPDSLHFHTETPIVVTTLSGPPRLLLMVQ